MIDIQNIEIIISDSVLDEHKIFIDELIKNHNPIDILQFDISDKLKGMIGSWKYSLMLDSLYAKLVTTELMKIIESNTTAIKKHYQDSAYINNTAYDTNLHYEELDSTSFILMAILLYYKE